MGTRFDAICKKCGHHFWVSEGGGFFFHLLHCNKCGQEKSISFDETGDAHLRYVKGLSGPYTVASSAADKDIQENYPEPAITEAEYHKIVEETAGTCKCGGHFKFKSKPRCPKCHSTKYERDPDGGMICYD